MKWDEYSSGYNTIAAAFDAVLLPTWVAISFNKLFISPGLAGSLAVLTLKSHLSQAAAGGIVISFRAEIIIGQLYQIFSFYKITFLKDVHPEGLEPPTPPSEAECSIH